jgi:hypothetical protein
LSKHWLVAALFPFLGVMMQGGGLAMASESAACRLMERTQEYHRLIRKGDIRRMEKLRSAGTPRMTRDHISYLKDLTKGLHEYQVRILAVAVHGHQAKVRQQVLGKYRKGAGEWDLNQEAEWFWVYEDGDWYRLPLAPPDWNETEAVDLRLPGQEECKGR